MSARVLRSTELEEIAQAAQAGGRIALDTEFMGEGRYRTLLCLIQLAVPQGNSSERIELLDPLADDFDGGPLAQVLADPSVMVVVHSGRQDIALIRRCLQTEVRNVFDTQVAAGFVGMPAQASYESLLDHMLRVRVAKSASFTRWDARPLSAEQLAYAREDVVHLLALASRSKRAWSGSAGCSGRARSAKRSSRPATSEIPRWCSRACRGFAASAPLDRRWRASWCAGASSSRRLRIDRCRACCPTRPSWRWPSANRAPPKRCPRCAV